MPKSKISVEKKQLYRRYLLWCYKTTREDLERIDRKFTQLDVDEFLLRHLQSKLALGPPLNQKYIDDFKQYMAAKRAEAQGLAFEDQAKGRLQGGYAYLQRRLNAVEGAIVEFLGKSELAKIRGLYEDEMTKRILEAREHK